jgi:hypothetical protein
LKVRVSNGDTMDSTHATSLDIPEFSQAASVAHVFPGMANHHLLSVVQLCNNVYYVTFKIDGVTIYNFAGKKHLEGTTGFEHRPMVNQLAP